MLFCSLNIDSLICNRNTRYLNAFNCVSPGGNPRFKRHEITHTHRERERERERESNREVEKKVVTRLEPPPRYPNAVVRFRESAVGYRITKLRRKIRQSEWHILRVSAGTCPRIDYRALKLNNLANRRNRRNVRRY